MKRVYLILALMFLISLNIFAVSSKKHPENVEVPKKIKIISQSCNITYLFISAIDLSNSEFIIMIYSHGGKNSYLENVIRTGTFVNVENQETVPGTDMPFEKNND